MLGIWGTVVEKLSAVDVSWPMFTLTQPLQGGLGANTLFSQNSTVNCTICRTIIYTCFGACLQSKTMLCCHVSG